MAGSPRPGREAGIAVLLAGAAALFRLPGLGTPDVAYFDEIYHARTALEYLTGQPPTDWVHPPTAKLLMAVPIALLGYDAWAWRLAPALAGIALAPVFFWLARRVTRSERGGWLAAVLLLSDGVYLVQSRIAMTNIFAVLFQVAAVLLVLRAAEPDRPSAARVLAIGIALGLAVSTRWTSFWAAGFLAVVWLALRGRRALRSREQLLFGAAWLVLPAAIYAASYLPWMAQRHDLTTAAGLSAGLAELGPEQVRVWRYHADLRADHPYFSPWYTWPWLVKPAWYHFDQSGGVVRGVLATGNPLVWWAAVPVTLWALVAGVRRRDPRLLLAGSGFCALYLPWALSPRILNFSHYLFEAIPYACLSLGLLLDAHWDGRWRFACRTYVAATVAVFLLLVPLLTAMPIPASLYHRPLWWS